MGWNTWNKFGCKINEKLIMETADYIVKLGLDKVGYQYVNVDDCWLLEERDKDSRIIVDPKAFPSGMKALSDYIHSKGLKFGLYSSAGYFSCEHRAGSMGKEEIDAKDLASWGVDYVKYDNCNHGGQPNYVRFKKMSDEIRKAGRPMFFSICNWGDENAPVWGKEVGNSWRTTQDIFNHFTSVEYNFN
jgi:alpha-galactosidase